MQCIELRLQLGLLSLKHRLRFVPLAQLALQGVHIRLQLAVLCTERRLALP